MSRLTAALCAGSVLALMPASAASAASGDIERVSFDTVGSDPNGESRRPRIDGDGGIVVFDSVATDLDTGDTNSAYDVYVWDPLLPLDIDLVSVDTNETHVDDEASQVPVITDDGGTVAFQSFAELDAADVGPNDRNIFARFLGVGSTGLVERDGTNQNPSGDSDSAAVDNDGTHGAFVSTASDIVGTMDPNGATPDVFVFFSGSGRLVSVSADGNGADNLSFSPAISGDGDAVAFASSATDLLPGGQDSNSTTDVFVRSGYSGVTQATERVSVTSSGQQAPAGTISLNPDISDGGQLVAFSSSASLTAEGGDVNHYGVFVRDIGAGLTERLDLAFDGSTPSGSAVAAGQIRPSLSDDGRYVAFTSTADDLVPGDTNGEMDVFVRDRTEGRTIRVSVRPDGSQTDDRSASPDLSAATGQFVAFESSDEDLILTDNTAGSPDIFRAELDWAAPETSVTSAPPATLAAPGPVQLGFAQSGAAEPGGRFVCRVDAGGWQECTSPFTTPALAAGSHTVEAAAVDRFGNIDQSPAGASVAVAGPSQPPPPPGNQPPPQPDFRQDFNAELVSGTVLVTLPDGRRVRLEDLLNIPAGSVIDARNGEMRLTVETKDGRLESSVWSAGIFKPVQLANGILECRLAGPLQNVGASAAAAGPRAHAAARRRRLWGNGKGKFRTKGNFASGTVRGTKWLTEDRPGLTLILVRRGRVAVRDRVRKKTVILTKGERYVARRPKKK